MRTRKFWFLVAISLGLAGALTAEQPVKVTYIANEGVLISAGQDQVIIDGLHGFYKTAYLHTPPKLLEKMHRGVKPFDSVDLLLVSHIHSDHFDPVMVRDYLQKQPKVVFFATPQAADSVLKYIKPNMNVHKQIVKAKYGSGIRSVRKQGEITVEITRIAHGGATRAWIQNAGHIISVGGKRFLHIGDPSFGEADFEKLQLQKEPVDVGILPAWFLTSKQGRKMIDTRIKPKHLIAVHVTPARARQVRRDVAKHYPDAHVFTEPLDTVIY